MVSPEKGNQCCLDFTEKRDISVYFAISLGMDTVGINFIQVRKATRWNSVCFFEATSLIHYGGLQAQLVFRVALSVTWLICMAADIDVTNGRT